MPKMLNSKQASLAANAKIRKQSTQFTGTTQTQKVPGKHLRAVTYLYPPGSRRTGKPSDYKA